MIEYQEERGPGYYNLTPFIVQMWSDKCAHLERRLKRRTFLFLASVTINLYLWVCK